MIKKSVSDNSKTSKAHDEWCSSIIRALNKIEPSYIKDTQAYKERVLGQTSVKSAQTIFIALNKELQEKSRKENLTTLLGKKVPFELLVEYLGAAKFTHSTETRSQVFQRLARKGSRKQDTSAPSRKRYIMGYMAFAGSFVLAGAAFASFLHETHPIYELANQVSSFAPKLIKKAFDYGDFIEKHSKGFSLAVYGVIAFGATHFQQSRGKDQAVEIESFVNKKSNNLAEDWNSHLTPQTPFLTGFE